MKRMRQWIGLVVVIVTAALSLVAGTPVSLEPGTKVPEFALRDVAGKEHSLAEYLKSPFTVVMFIATRCPVSNAYNDRMVSLANDYGSRGVAFVAINSNVQEGIDEIRDHASKHGFRFAVLKDSGNVVADAYGAQVTPEIFLVDSHRILRYHGRIDDSREVDEVTTSDLRVALDAVLAGHEVPRATTKAFGCSIKRAAR